MVQVNYCLVTQNIASVIEDSNIDDDRFPDIELVNGDVTFIPNVSNGSSYQVELPNGQLYTVPLGRIRAKIVNGQISHEGDRGVHLFAAGDGSNPSKISYSVSYSNLRAGGVPVSLNSFSFQAVPGGEVDLTGVMPVSGATPAGTVRGPRGTSLESIDVDGSDLVFTTVNESGSFEMARIPIDHVVEAEAREAARLAANLAVEGVNEITASGLDGPLYSLFTTPGTATHGWMEENSMPVKTTEAQETSTIGAELVTSDGWEIGTGWSGDFSGGFTHTPGSTEPLVWSPTSPLEPGTYLVEWMWDGTTTEQDKYSGFDVTLGDGEAGIIYQGAAPNNVNYSRAIKMTTAGNLVFTPWTMFEGRIHSISIRKVVSAAQIGAGFKDSAGYRTAELRFGKSAQYNIFFGTDSGKWNFSGNRNVAIGDMAMRDNVTGFFNAAIGYEALRNNVSGTRNMAIGYRALAENMSGDRNVGIGPFALTRNTTGQRNVAIGVDVLWRSTTGDDNVGIGYLTQTELRSGESNIAIGRYAMRHTRGATDGSTAHNIAVGREALGRVTGVGNIGIGRRSLASTVGREGNVAIGDYALEVSDTVQQTAVGKESLRYFTGGRNTAFGNNALKGVSGASTGSRNVAVGDNAAIGLTSGSNNTVIGPSAGPDLATARNNILIGFSTYTQGNRDDFLNIGNVLYGDLAGKKFGIGLHTPTARLHLLGGSSSEGTAPLKFSDGTLTSTPEAGALEFAGGKLYFTPTTGTRREIAFVTTP